MLCFLAEGESLSHRVTGRERFLSNVGWHVLDVQLDCCTSALLFAGRHAFVLPACRCCGSMILYPAQRECG